MTKTMRKLDTVIHYKGFVYEQEYRDDTYAIYSQCFKGDNEVIAYELIKIRKNKAREQFGKHFEACESYPTDRMWGDFGWTFKELRNAKKRLAEYQSKT